MALDLATRTLFVTATDTGVGKTAVAGALAAVLRRRGRDVGVMKPISSGCAEVNGGLVSADGLCLARAAGVGDAHELICPVRLRPALSPNVAAEREGRSIDLAAVRDAARVLAARHDALIVEGIGGLLVPIAPGSARAKPSCGRAEARPAVAKPGFLVADLAAEFGAPLLVVGRAGLGTINHSLLTVEAARARGLRVAAVLLNSASDAPRGLAEETNPGEIAEVAGVPVLGPLGWCAGVSTESGELAELPAMLAALDGVDGLVGQVFGV